MKKPIAACQYPTVQFSVCPCYDLTIKDDLTIKGWLQNAAQGSSFWQEITHATHNALERTTDIVSKDQIRFDVSQLKKLLENLTQVG